MVRHYASLRISGLGLLMLSSIVFAAALTMSEPPARVAIPQVTVDGPFTFIAPDGTTVTDDTLQGKWLLVFFSCTFYPDLCPMTLSEIAGALERLGSDAAIIQPIFITVDLERDTPELMGQYTQAFDSNILGPTGNPQQFAAVSQEYGVYSEKRKTGVGNSGHLADHSTYINIMSPQGRFLRGLDFDMPSKRIADTLRELMARDEP